MRRSFLLAACVYLVVVGSMWAPFNPMSGMPYETAFPYTSETVPVWQGFFYSDSLRMHTNTFYHLSYLIGQAAGVRGSFVPYQVVYALLWWAQGLLIYLIARRFFPASPVFCYLAGVLALVHSSDGALQWVGQMNQLGFIFWMLLAFYMLVLAYQEQRIALRRALLLAAVFFEYMSLWSYESQLFLILAAPALLPALAPQPGRLWRWVKCTAAWYVFPAVYLYLSVRKYTATAGTYQQSVLRPDFSPASLAGDWLFNIAASLKFWAWAREGRPEGVPGLLFWLPPVLALVAVAAGGFLLYRRQRELPGRTALAAAAAVGLALVGLSFPAYLLLGSARSLWRTQFLSGPGAALALAAGIGLCAIAIKREWLRVGVLAALTALVAGYGINSALEKGAFHRRIWDRHRRTMAQILRAAPRINPATVVVLLDVPRNEDPFGDDLWFDMALRLSYPGTLVGGVYFLDDGRPAPGNELELDGESWKWNGKGMPELKQAGVGNTIVLRHAQIMERLPELLHPTPRALELYRPSSAILPGPPSPLAVRRYDPYGPD